MKNYSDYHGLNMNEKLSHDGLLILERSLTGFEADDVTINNSVNTRLLVYQKYDADSRTKKIIGRIEDVELGNILKIGDSNWIVVTFPEDNKIYRKAEIQLCNSTYPIKANKTRLLIGHNPKTGEPIYQTIDGQITHIPCIVETKYSAVNDNVQLPLPDGQMIVTLQYQIAENLQISSEFTMYSTTYEITDIDFTKVLNGKGIMRLIAEKVVKKA